MSSSKVTVELLTELLQKQSDSILEAVAKLLKEHAAVSAPVEKPKKSKSKKSADVDGSEPKPKREPNEWIKFSQRVERLVRETEAEAGKTKEEKMPTVVTKQFASYLKTQKAYAEWEDDEIKAALDGWEAPVVSKQKERKSSAESAASGASAEKPKRKWSDEAKATAAAKRAAKKAAAAAASVEDSDAESEAEKPKAAAKPAASKPKVAKPAAKPVDKKAQMRFSLWSHDGTDYWKNSRGDVVSSEMDWVGHWNGKKIDESAAQPEDLEEAEFESTD